MFYFFFESRKAKADPVVIWLTGGPGCTSELALFSKMVLLSLRTTCLLSEMITVGIRFLTLYMLTNQLALVLVIVLVIKTIVMTKRALAMTCTTSYRFVYSVILE